MAAGRHLVLDLSSHGLGHLGQAAPVVEALRRAAPGMRLTVRSHHDGATVAGFLEGPFELSPPPPDVGMKMRGPMEVDAAQSLAAYEAIFAGWDALVAREAERMAALAPDLVLVDIPFVSLAAAEAARVPAAALCSLNWADVFLAYCGDAASARPLHECMARAYDSARVFLQAAPHMPMENLANLRPIGPIARLGRDRREALMRAAGGRGERFVAVSMGGIGGRFASLPLPEIEGVVWLTPADWNLERPDVLSRRGLDLPFIDLLRSADAVVSKTGYGIFVEAGCNGTRLLYAERVGWPETPYLEAWAARSGAALKVERAALEEGAIAGPLRELLDRPAPAPRRPSGVGEAADALLPLLQGAG